jgi:putative hydrolase of HD superfamily
VISAMKFAAGSALGSRSYRHRHPAAHRLFALLPSDQAAEFRVLWDEFEELKTPEAKFAKALDRLQPLLHNYQAGG